MGTITQKCPYCGDMEMEYVVNDESGHHPYWECFLCGMMITADEIITNEIIKDEKGDNNYESTEHYRY